MKVRSAIFAVFILLVPATVQGQVIGIAPLRSQPPERPEDKTIKVRITPAGEPSPALRFRLLPDYLQTSPGNSAQHYFRAFAPEWSGNRDKEFRKALNDWNPNAGKKPEKILLSVLNDNALKQVDLAARKRHCDWDLLQQMKKDGIAMLLPDVQGFRDFSRKLALRARLQILEGKYDEAVYTMQTGLKLGRDVGEGPTLIHMLVGIAICSQMLTEIEFMSQRKDAPNMYWALADLPRPFQPMRKQLQGERALFDSLFPGFRKLAWELDAPPMDQGQLDRALDKFLKAKKLIGVRDTTEVWVGRLGLAVMAAKTYPVAKKVLLAQGRPPELVKKMPILQVVMIYETQNYDRYFDDMAKWCSLPYPQARKGLRETEKRLREEVDKSGSTGIILAKLLLPAMESVVTATHRIDRKIATLRYIESIRNYAEHNDGKIPTSPDQLKTMPAPSDPLTEEPFEYRVRGNTIFLTAPVPKGDTPRWQTNHWTYEITVQK